MDKMTVFLLGILLGIVLAATAADLGRRNAEPVPEPHTYCAVEAWSVIVEVSDGVFVEYPCLDR